MTSIVEVIRGLEAQLLDVVCIRAWNLSKIHYFLAKRRGQVNVLGDLLREDGSCEIAVQDLALLSC